ncbi:energy transducer TonB [Hydrocarboniphaga sp.]|uniref:energy transducer TonB n=1 Tax=Hydrocarboniphaga sp. TaxID=2033016 RepID=UPI003D14A1B4
MTTQTQPIDALSWPSRTRWLWLPPAALLITWLLFLLMVWAIRSRDSVAEPEQIIEDVRVVQTQRDDNPPQDPMKTLQNAPPPPPAAPPSLAQAAVPALSMPAIAVAPVDVGAIAVPTGSLAIGGGPSLGSSGSFGGFAGSGGGGNGTGSGAGGGGGAWKGKPLVPLSTARPQMPEWACKQKLGGWVEAIFTVDPDGHVKNVRIINAEPRGVFEAAAVESIGNWLYERTGKSAEVRQRVPMDPADCAYNYR